MKVEAVVFGVMQAVTINCESILPGLNTTSKSIGVEGGGWWSSHEMAGSYDLKT